jgi:hypothetical protein
MIRDALMGVTVAALLATTEGCAARTTDPAPGNVEVGSAAAAVAEFHDRVERYMVLRQDAVDDVRKREVTADPALIRGREEALAAGIRARRAAARHGDIFSARVRPVFRQFLRSEFKGAQGEDLRAILQDDAPRPDAVPIEVNARYPAGVPFPTTPAAVLLTLPRLPAGLEYRIIRKDLILLDQPADVILDYIRNAIP